MDGRAVSGWRLVPRFLLRRAGFAFPMLDGLADPAVLIAAERYRGTRASVERTRGRLLGDVVPHAVRESRARGDGAALRRLSALRTSIGHRRTVVEPEDGPPALRAAVAELVHAQDQLTAAESALRDALVAERGARGDRLRRFADDDAVRDAILQLSPGFYDALVRRPPVALGRRLYLYSQRLASKNETTSFFGPVTHGTVDAGTTGFDLGPARDALTTRAFLAFWATVALGQRMTRDPAVALPISWVPAATRLPGRLVLADGRRVAVDPQAEKVLDAIDDARGATALAEDTGVPLAEVTTLLTRLGRLGVVRGWPEPPSTVLQPFDDLLAHADRYAAGTPWPADLRRLWTLVEAYRDAPGAAARRTALDALEHRFTTLSGVPARRAGGHMYADRAVAYLDCAGDLTPLRMGGDVASTITGELAPVLDLAARYGELCHAESVRAARAILATAGVDRIGYDAFVRLARGVEPPDGGAGFVAALTEVVGARTVAGRAALDPGDLAPLSTVATAPRFVSPDVLLGREPDGSHFLVLGELHPYVYAWGSQALFSDDPAGLQSAFAAALAPWGGPGSLATVVHRRRHKGLVGDWFPGRLIEVTAVACRDRRRTVPLTALTVVADADRVRLVGPDGDDLVLYAGEDDHLHLVAFAPAPVRLPVIWLGDTAPRVTVGRVVVQRARWRLDERLDRATAFVAAQDLRVRRGLPRWVYAHVPGEPKPICVDLDCPLAVETLAAAIAATGGATGTTLTEMLPEPHALWLRRSGQPVTSELRLALVRGPA